MNIVDGTFKGTYYKVEEKEDGCNVIRRSPFSNKLHERAFNINFASIIGYYNRTHGQSVQDAFPMLNADEREFIMTGITPKEWDAVVK